MWYLWTTAIIFFILIITLGVWNGLCDQGFLDKDQRINGGDIPLTGLLFAICASLWPLLLIVLIIFAPYGIGKFIAKQVIDEIPNKNEHLTNTECENEEDDDE